ncbi:MAG TPA: quinol:electron acceptor oxidoreductase subunit ActD [Acidisarcina sp.]|nr:quinol:electron acceptor oxidoreductase subunit ActD [Acidisarcina sp.]
MAEHAVFGIFASRQAVEDAVAALRDADFRQSDISILAPENLGDSRDLLSPTTKAPEGAATGAASGAVVGGVLGWLAGIGALAIPGVGPFLAAGPILAALAGLGVGGALGGITGALVGLGLPEHEARRYERRLVTGAILVSVHADNAEWARLAKEILKSAGAEEISDAGESRAA